MKTAPNEIRRQILLKAPPERVWSALTDAEQFSSWFGNKVEGQFAAGTDVYMTYQEMRLAVKIEEMTPPRVFRWKWHPGMPDSSVDYSKEPMTEVTFTLEPKDGGTLLTVVETGFDALSLSRRAAVLADNEQGWDIQLRNIEAYVARTAQ